jgi:hypothetical protein
MRKIKLFEDFKNDEFIGSEVLELLRPLSKFYFNYGVKFNSGRLIITISKKDPERIKVFEPSDISPILTEIDNYLILGESMGLETIVVRTIEGEKELNSVKDINSITGLLSILLIYN